MTAVDYEGHIAAEPGVVGALLVDEAFLRAYVAEIRAEPGRVESAAGPTSSVETASVETAAVETLVEWSLSTSKFPGFVRPLLGERLQVTERTVWSGPAAVRIGALTATIAVSRPATLTARLDLVAADAGTTMSGHGRLKVSVPMIGGKVEQLAAPYLLNGLKARVLLANRWLADGWQPQPG